MLNNPLTHQAERITHAQAMRKLMVANPAAVRYLSLSDAMLNVIEYVASHSDVTSADVAHAFGKRLSTANMQLRQLCHKRYLHRSAISATGGGVLYLYRVAV